MEIKKSESLLTFYPDKDSMAMICCPACGFARKVDALKYRNTNKALTVKCKCGETFKCSVDFRKSYRKRVNLAGEYTILKNQKKGEMLVEDISLGGLGFNNMAHHSLENGDVLELKFRLDDPNRSELVRKVSVKIVKGHFVGTEFMEKNRFDKEIGFYLSP